MGPVCDESGWLRSRVDPRGNEPGADPLDYDTRYSYDDADHITSVEDPLGHRVGLTYDDVGNLAARTNQLGRVTRYRYRADNLLSTCGKLLPGARALPLLSVRRGTPPSSRYLIGPLGF